MQSVAITFLIYSDTTAVSQSYYTIVLKVAIITQYNIGERA